MRMLSWDRGTLEPSHCLSAVLHAQLRGPGHIGKPQEYLELCRFV